LKRKVRDRTRSVNKRVRAIAMASLQKAAGVEEHRKKEYRELLRYSRQILNDTKRVMQEVEEMPTKQRKGQRHLSGRCGCSMALPKRQARWSVCLSRT